MRIGDIVYHTLHFFPLKIIDFKDDKVANTEDLLGYKEFFEIKVLREVDQSYIDGYFYRSDGSTESDKQFAKWLNLNIG